MSTRSAIAIMDENTGKIRSVYCHWDGYPEHNGAILEEYYTEREKIEELLTLGSISLLAGRVKPKRGEKHTFDKPVKGVVIAYHRDRKQEYVKPDEWESESELVRETERAYWAEYVYLWKFGCWCVYETHGMVEYDATRWNTVADALSVCGV